MTAGSGFCALYIVIAGAPAIIVTACFGQKPDSRPREINPGGPGRAPSDAVVLFDGKDMSHWTTRDGKPARCQVQSGEMVCLTGVGDIYSREKFRSAQIHLEFAIPFMPEQKDQMRGNSGSTCTASTKSRFSIPTTTRRMRLALAARFMASRRRW